MTKITGPAGSYVLLLSNEAIARGALKKIRSSFSIPCTSSTEIVEALLEALNEDNFYV